MALSRGNQIHFFLVLASCHFAACELVGTSSLPGSPSLASKRSTLNTRSSLEISDSESLLRLRGGSTSAVSEARLKAQAQALAAVKAKASQMGAKKGATAAELTTSTAAAAAAAAAASSSEAGADCSTACGCVCQRPDHALDHRGSAAGDGITGPDTAREACGEASAGGSDEDDVDSVALGLCDGAASAERGAEAAGADAGGGAGLGHVTAARRGGAGAGDLGRGEREEGDGHRAEEPAAGDAVQGAAGAATDPEMKKRLDARIFELEAAWQNYVKVDVSTTQHSLFAPKPIKINRSPSELVLDERTARRGRTRIPVTFTVRCPLTQVGEKVLLLGDAEELGSWNPLAAVPLETTNNTYPLWHATVDMPAGAIVEYKYAIGTPGIFREQFDIVEWEGYMGNRGFKVPRKAYHIHEDYVEGINHGQELDYNIPEYLTMHRIGGSECFLDPEYASIY
eukprot:CAMPEP_0177706588 /NCGR_PEP_ID=MMETSP0484_2-20121128/9304_1 /TAXON_ID=354590 /ORGANISM="Rhodomonas lens, Strain RHODO" /LENGTH=454 /DNA_ID=CAMNT_0019218057 /DNA_START=354 /DNA_END=1718 /DNA_ORIENTATION=+